MTLSFICSFIFGFACGWHLPGYFMKRGFSIGTAFLLTSGIAILGGGLITGLLS